MAEIHVEHKPNRTWLWIVAIIVIALIAWWIYAASDDDNETTTTPATDVGVLQWQAPAAPVVHTPAVARVA